MNNENKKICISDHEKTFTTLTEWTEDPKITIMAENEEDAKLDFSEKDVWALGASKCSLVLRDFRYEMPLPQEQTLYISAEVNPGNGLVISINNQPALFLAKEDTDLKSFPSTLKQIILNQPVSFEALSLFPQLTDLRINNYRGNDLSTLPPLQTLQTLGLDHCLNLESLRGLRRCENLQSLHCVVNHKLNNTKELAYLQNLRSLKLIFCSRITRIKELDKLTRLEDFFVGVCKMFREAEFPAGCSSLISVEFTALPRLKSLIIHDASRLESLKLSFLPKLTHMSIGNPVALTDLDVSFVNKIQAIEELENTIKLKNIQPDE